MKNNQFIGKNLVPLFVKDDIYRFSNNPIFKNDTEINFIDYSNKDFIYKYIKMFIVDCEINKFFI